MVQSREGLWFSQPARRRGRGRGYLRPHGDSAPVADCRPSARTAARGADCGRAQGPDRGRATRTLITRAVALGLVASLAACQPSASSAVELGQSPAGLEQVQLTISSAGKTHRFTVEVASTPEQQAMGLMYRTKRDPDRGMIFPFDPPRDASFWMRNTLIPLDMVFIRADGSIAKIAENTA